MVSLTVGPFDVEVALRAKAEVSGDTWLAAPSAEGIMVGMFDGAGSGEAAREVSARARSTVSAARLSGQPVEARLVAAHLELQGSRGCVASIALIDPNRGTFSWAGVGNVDGALLTAARPRRLVSSRGMLGVRTPDPIRSEALRWRKGDLLVLGTDGARKAFAALPERAPGVARGLAAQWLEAFADPRDDAALMVVKL